MDKNRFLNYARYDLTIHAAFYRNLALLSTIIMLSITLLGFLFRWWDKAYNHALYGDYSGYTHIAGTVVILAMAMGLMMNVYAACFNHPLANRQDRLKTLTLPATNGEKFLWHTLLVIVGGALQLTVALLLCDALNALLSLLCGFSHVYSLTAGIWSMVSLTGSEALGFLNDPLREIAVMRLDAFRLWLSIVVMLVVSFVWELSAFVYGNSFKYRYNILWTMLGLWVLESVVSIVMVMAVSIASTEGVEMLDDMARDDVFDFLTAMFWGFNVVLIVTAALMWWHSWVRYRHAQITSWLNK